MSPLLDRSLDQLQAFFFDCVPHSHLLGMRLVECVKGRLVVDMPYHAKLVDPDSGAIHNGAVTALLDSVCGSAALTELEEMRRTATLDLRIDYLRPAQPGRTVRCEAACHRTNDQIAFVRAIAHDGDPADAVALASGTFVVFRTAARVAASAGNAS